MSSTAGPFRGEIASAALDLKRIAAAIEIGADLSDQERQTAAASLRQMALPASRFAERDRLAADCVHRYFGHCRSLHDASEEMAPQFGRYRATPWLRDKSAKECPSRLAGTMRESFWLILRTIDRPLTADRIRRIVGAFEVPKSARDEFCS